MKVLMTNPSGELLRKEQTYLGGALSLQEKLQKRGSGSPRILYMSGNVLLDQLDRKIAGEITFVNFEWLKDGIVIRANRNQRIICLGCRLSEIVSIALVGYRIEIKEKRLFGYRTRTVHRGELTITNTNGTISQFCILVSEFKAMVQFFEKSDLKNRFSFSISTDPPEQLTNEWLELLRWLAGGL